MDKTNNIGQRVKTLREGRKLSQRGLAALCGCSGPTISDIENGHTRFPSAEVLARMCKVFGVTERYMLYGQEGEIIIPTEAQQQTLNKLTKLTENQRKAILAMIDSMLPDNKS